MVPGALAQPRADPDGSAAGVSPCVIVPATTAAEERACIADAEALPVARESGQDTRNVDKQRHQAGGNGGGNSRRKSTIFWRSCEVAAVRRQQNKWQLKERAFCERLCASKIRNEKRITVFPTNRFSPSKSFNTTANLLPSSPTGCFL